MIYKNNEKGITLVALVVTVIVLLILVFITVGLALGENGVITRTKQASLLTKKTEEQCRVEMAVAGLKIANDINKDSLQKEVSKTLRIAQSDIEVSRDSIRGVDAMFYVLNKKTNSYYEITPSGIVTNETELNEIKTKHKDQVNSNTIGVDQNGNLVNMDYWRCHKYSCDLYDEHGSGDYRYCLSGEIDEDGTIEESGYCGPIVDGKIAGNIPKFIKLEGDTQFYRVDSLCYTFANLQDLETPPVLFDGIVDLYSTFFNDKNLKIAPRIPRTVSACAETFTATAITRTPTLPDGLKVMYCMFKNCKSLKEITNIPDSVISIEGTFIGCTNLENVDLVLSENLEKIDYAFWKCSKLSGKIEFNSSKIGIIISAFENAATEGDGLLLAGTASNLQEIFNTKSENSKITLNN